MLFTHNLNKRGNRTMTTFPLQPLSTRLFIENGLNEIFGIDLLKESAKTEKQLPMLASLRQCLTRKIGSDEVGGMYIRAGRAGFYYWMKELSNPMGWKTVSFRLLPPTARIRRAMTDLLQWMESEKFFKAELTETPESWRIAVNGLTGKEAHLDCDYFIGMVQELTCWAGGGKFFQAREIECQAGGAAACVFVIGKMPAG
jgi:hypothetical protein